MFQFEKNALQNFLKAVAFPIDRPKLLAEASKHDLPAQVVSMLQRLPEQSYANAEEVDHALAAHAV